MKRAFITLVLVLAACTTTPTGELTRESRLGVATVLSGPYAYLGTDIKRGAQVAESLYEQQNGDSLSLIFADDKCRPKATVSALTKLVTADGIRTIAGPSCTASVIPGFVQRNDAVLLSPYVNFGNLSKSFITIRPHARKEGRIMGRFAAQNLSLERAGVIHYKGSWGNILRRSFTESFERHGGTVVGSHGFLSDRDFRTFLTKLRERDADSVYFVGTYMNSLARQIRELGMNVTVVSQFGVENDKTRAAINGSIELYYTHPSLNTDHLFFDAYRERFGEPAGAISAFSYDTTRFLARAKNACRSMQCVREYLLNNTFSGATGTVDINATTYTGRQDMVIKTFSNGHFVRYGDTAS